MHEKYVFVEKTVAGLILLISFFIGLAGAAAFFYGYKSYGDGNDASVYIFPVICFLPFIFVLLLSFLSKPKMITCDLSGCEIMSKSIWQSDWLPVDRFFWRDVSEITLTAVGFKPVQYILTVLINGTEKQLLNHYHASKEDFDNLLTVAGRATPQLPYVWVKSENVENLRVLESKSNFKKVARN